MFIKLYLYIEEFFFFGIDLDYIVFVSSGSVKLCEWVSS